MDLEPGVDILDESGLPGEAVPGAVFGVVVDFYAGGNAVLLKSGVKCGKYSLHPWY